MTLEECYAVLEGNYAGVMSRLGREEMVMRFLAKFKDRNSLEAFEDAYKNGDYETAFREIHNIKGVSANLGLSRLEVSAGELTECFRGVGAEGPAMDVTPLLEKVRSDYAQTMETLDQLL